MQFSHLLHFVFFPCASLAGVIALEAVEWVGHSMNLATQWKQLPPKVDGPLTVTISISIALWKMALQVLLNVGALKRWHSKDFSWSWGDPGYSKQRHPSILKNVSSNFSRSFWRKENDYFLWAVKKVFLQNLYTVLQKIMPSLIWSMSTWIPSVCKHELLRK